LADEPSRPKNLKEEPVLLAPVIITAPRSAVRGIAADRTIGADAIPATAPATIDELVGELASESGEDDPVVIVNGERIDDYGTCRTCRSRRWSGSTSCPAAPGPRSARPRADASSTSCFVAR
jgi:hypothetical protein